MKPPADVVRELRLPSWWNFTDAQQVQLRSEAADLIERLERERAELEEENLHLQRVAWQP